MGQFIIDNGFAVAAFIGAFLGVLAATLQLTS